MPPGALGTAESPSEARSSAQPSGIQLGTPLDDSPDSSDDVEMVDYDFSTEVHE